MPSGRPHIGAEDPGEERGVGEAGALEAILGHSFADPALLREALTHRSAAREGSGPGPGRLEFLGDAVLELLVRVHLMKQFPGDPEGSLTKRKALLVSEKALAEAGRASGMDRFVYHGVGMQPADMPDSVIAGVMEAIIGAVFLDSGGLAGAAQAVGRMVLAPLSGRMDGAPVTDACSRLQELCQGRSSGMPKYHSARTGGPDHRPRFSARVEVAGQVFGPACGCSKKEAQQAAAAEALEAMESEE